MNKATDSNRENYKKAFSVLESSRDFDLEDEKMARLQKNMIVKRLVAAAVICLVVIGGTGTAYAHNVGGIQQIIQMWIHGNQTDVTLDFDGEGGYKMSYTDEDGNISESEGGGIAIEPDGTERPLTEDEIMEDFSDGSNSIDVVVDEETDRITLYYLDQAQDITDEFVDGYYRTTVNIDGQDYYISVAEDGAYSVSPDKYEDVYEDD